MAVMSMKRFIALIISCVLFLPLTSSAFADDSDTYKSRSGILLDSAAGVPANVLRDPLYQTPEGYIKMEALKRAYSRPLNLAAEDFEATTGMTLNFIIEEELNFGSTVDEEISAIVSSGNFINGRPADNQILMVCVENGSEVSFVAGDTVKAVITEDELQRAADIIEAAQGELMVQRALWGVRELFVCATDDVQENILPLSRAGEYLKHPDLEVLTDLSNVSVFYDSEIASGQGGTQEEAAQAASIEYLLDILHYYSGAAVYLYEFAQEREPDSGVAAAYASAEEAAQGMLDMSHAQVYAFKKLMCCSENNGISIAYNTTTGDGAILLEDDVKNYLTDEDIKSILTAFSIGADSKYRNVLAGICRLYRCIFDNSDMEYPSNSIVTDVLNYGKRPEKVFTKVICSAVIFVTVVAVVIIKKTRKRDPS